MKVVIGVPSGDMLHADFAMRLCNLVLYSASQGIQVAIVNPKFSLLEIGRCEIALQAAKAGADKVLFLDSDMLFPHDALLILLQYGLDIIGCDAVRRRAPHTSVLLDTFGKPIDHKTTSGVIEVSRLSTACLLVDMKVFDKIDMPAFKVEWDAEKKQFTGEDYYFSKQCLKHGFKLHCCTDLSKDIGHMGVSAHYVPKYNPMN